MTKKTITIILILTFALQSTNPPTPRKLLREDMLRRTSQVGMQARALRARSTEGTSVPKQIMGAMHEGARVYTLDNKFRIQVPDEIRERYAGKHLILVPHKNGVIAVWDALSVSEKINDMAARLPRDEARAKMRVLGAFSANAHLSNEGKITFPAQWRQFLIEKGLWASVPERFSVVDVGDHFELRPVEVSPSDASRQTSKITGVNLSNFYGPKTSSAATDVNAGPDDLLDRHVRRKDIKTAASENGISGAMHEAKLPAGLEKMDKIVLQGAKDLLKDIKEFKLNHKKWLRPLSEGDPMQILGVVDYDDAGDINALYLIPRIAEDKDGTAFAAVHRDLVKEKGLDQKELGKVVFNFKIRNGKAIISWFIVVPNLKDEKNRREEYIRTARLVVAIMQKAGYSLKEISSTKFQVSTTLTTKADRETLISRKGNILNATILDVAELPVVEKEREFLKSVRGQLDLIKQYLKKNQSEKMQARVKQIIAIIDTKFSDPELRYRLKDALTSCYAILIFAKKQKLKKDVILRLLDEAGASLKEIEKLSATGRLSAENIKKASIQSGLLDINRILPVSMLGFDKVDIKDKSCAFAYSSKLLANENILALLPSIAKGIANKPDFCVILAAQEGQESRLEQEVAKLDTKIRQRIIIVPEDVLAMTLNGLPDLTKIYYRTQEEPALEGAINIPLTQDILNELGIVIKDKEQFEELQKQIVNLLQA